jgi:ribosomal 30S subunit maturation factor RimM
VGEVTAVLETKGTPVLVCRGAAGETLIPLAEPFIRAIHVEEQRIIVTLLETIDAAD